MSEAGTILETDHLSVSYRTASGQLKAVDDVSVKLRSGRITAIVGESGCGKSTLGLALSRLLPERQVSYDGRVLFEGRDLLSVPEGEMTGYRGTQIATIFQEPMSSLNPVYRVGDQIAEAILVRNNRVFDSEVQGGRAASKKSLGYMLGINSYLLVRGRNLYERYSEQVEGFLARVRISEPSRVATMYPHELSGGMRQRVMIAMALCESPKLLVADEVTTALDVTTQTKILNIMKGFARDYGMGVLMITHDLGIVAAVSDYVYVMYAGKIAEQSPTEEIFQNPMHPYTKGLIDSFPRGRKDSFNLKSIPGNVPTLGHYPSACRFNPRCPRVFGRCRVSAPELTTQSGEDHKVACFLYDSVAA